MSSQAAPGALNISRKVLSVLIVMNVIAAVLILVLLVASLVAREWAMQALGVARDAESGAHFLGMQMIMVFGIVSASIAHATLSKLRAIVNTVRQGDPFVAENAERLKKIAWAVLTLELLRLIIAAVAKSVSTTQMHLNITWNFSVPSWLAVLLLFVLARVFETGARMRADLEGTV
ncbi:MAG: DUF2975 domain-containing protein [Gemmatimonas sp.]